MKTETLHNLERHRALIALDLKTLKDEIDATIDAVAREGFITGEADLLVEAFFDLSRSFRALSQDIIDAMSEKEG